MWGFPKSLLEVDLGTKRATVWKPVRRLAHRTWASGGLSSASSHFQTPPLSLGGDRRPFLANMREWQWRGLSVDWSQEERVCLLRTVTPWCFEGKDECPSDLVLQGQWGLEPSSGLCCLSKVGEREALIMCSLHVLGSWIAANNLSQQERAHGLGTLVFFFFCCLFWFGLGFREIFFCPYFFIRNTNEYLQQLIFSPYTVSIISELR